VFAVLLAQVVQKDLPQVGLARFLQLLHEEVFVVDHESLKLVLVQPLMLEFALVHFANARTVEVLAWEEAEIVRKAAIRAPVTVVRQREFAQLIFLSDLLRLLVVLSTSLLKLVLPFLGHLATHLLLLLGLTRLLLWAFLSLLARSIWILLWSIIAGTVFGRLLHLSFLLLLLQFGVHLRHVVVWHVEITSASRLLCTAYSTRHHALHVEWVALVTHLSRR